MVNYVLTTDTRFIPLTFLIELKVANQRLIPQHKFIFYKYTIPYFKITIFIYIDYTPTPLLTKHRIIPLH